MPSPVQHHAFQSTLIEAAVQSLDSVPLENDASTLVFAGIFNESPHARDQNGQLQNQRSGALPAFARVELRFRPMSSAGQMP